MKLKNIILSFMAMLVGILHFQTPAMAADCHSSHHKKSKRSKCQIPLRLKNRTNIISKPGHYVVQNSMKLLEGDTAILVRADNVHIDLCDHVLEGRGNDAGDLTIGIDFSDRKNISVKNGTVQKFSRFGLLAKNVEKILIEDFCAIKNGVAVGGSFSAGINISGTPDEGSGGSVCRYVTIRRALCADNFNTGLALPYCVDVSVTDTDCVQNYGCSFSGWTEGQGLYVVTTSPLPVSKNYYFENCRFNDNEVELPEGERGICWGARVQTLALFSGFLGTSFENFTFVRCEFDGNSCFGEAQESEGISLSNTKNASFTACSASNNFASVPEEPNFGVSVGFSLAWDNDVVVRDCQTNNNEGGGQGAYGTRLLGCRNVLFENTESNNNHSIGEGLGFDTLWPYGRFGFVVLNLTNHQWIGCIANNNQSDNSEKAQAGWRLVGVDGALLDSCVGNNNGHAGVMLSQFTAFEETTPMRDALIKNSAFTRNGCFGILDTSGSETNVYADNIGNANGFHNFELDAGFGTNNISHAQGLNPLCVDQLDTRQVTETQVSPFWKTQECKEILETLAEQGKISLSDIQAD